MKGHVLKNPLLRATVSILVAALVAFAGLAYGRSLAMPFVGDDYVFLDETLWASFPSLWSPTHTAFRWYRPWSRELHFWTIQSLAGASPEAFRLASLALWLIMLFLYNRFLRTFLSPAVSWIATLAASSLAMWGTPLLWVSGAQDLWMLAFGFCFLWLIALRRDLLALPVLVLALLSKETAAVFPLIGLAYMFLVASDRWSVALRRSLPVLVATALWAVWHPTLWSRLTTSSATDPEVLNRPSHLVIMTKDMLALLNLEFVPRPTEVTPFDVVFAALSACILAAAGLLAARLPGHPKVADSRRIWAFIAAWVVLGWAPLHLPSIGWHAYYGSIGAMAAWAGIAVLLLRRPVLIVAMLTILPLLRAADAKTQTWDWGNEWYMRRAGSLLSAIKAKLQAEYSQMPSHTRAFFARLPNNIGLVAGSSAAIRVWYHDPTLTADFYSRYRPRPPEIPPGADLFFRFDTLQVLVEIKAGPEDVLAAISKNPAWVDDHTKLAMLFLSAGQPSLAAEQFEKISTVPGHAQAILYGAVSRDLAGHTEQAESLYASYANHTRTSPDSVQRLARKLKSAVPSQNHSPS